MRRSVVVALRLAGLVAVVLTVAYVAGLGPFAGSLRQAAESRGQALIGGPLALVEHEGRRVSAASVAGRAQLVSVGYPDCPDMCPLGLATIAAAFDQLSAEEQARVVPLFVTVDPERDTVAAMADYVALFHPALVGLTGTPEEIAAATSAYRVYHRKAESESAGDYLVDHSTFTYLMDGDDAYVTHFGHDTQPAAIAAAVRTHLAASPAS